MKTLGDELPKEVARVRDLLPLYDELPDGAGGIAAAMMRSDLDAASRAMISGDVVEMVRVYQSLKGWRA